MEKPYNNAKKAGQLGKLQETKVKENITPALHTQSSF